ncbi:MAG: OST3/OST6 family protein [Candidatus Bathyarchaeota archaeon]|nr:OST3/OST6 family protein [Candidatus Bathyarchaeota archaeon]
MSDKAKKQASSLSFTLSQWFSKISTMKPSSLLVTGVVIGTALFLFGGGIYDIINQPYPAVYYNSRFYFLYPQLSEQFIFDTVISVILYAMGFVGLIALYQSSKHAYSPRQAYMTMVVGVTLLFLAYLFLEYFIRLKISGG